MEIKTVYRLFASILILIFLPVFISAQEENIKFERFSPERGAPRGTQCIVQDRKGFLWFGTFEGLVRYDGYQFKVYRHNPKNPSSLSNNDVWSICESKSGALWIGTDGGLNRLDPHQEKFTYYNFKSGSANSFRTNAIQSVLIDSSDMLWIGTIGDGLYKLDLKKLNIKNETPTREGILLEKDLWTHYKNEPGNQRSLSHNRVRTIYEDKTGILWIGTHGGGLNRFDREQEAFTRFKKEPANPNSLSGNVVWSICQDRTGALWIGTNEGLSKVVFHSVREINPEGGNRGNDQLRATWTHYKNEPGNPNSLGHNLVTSIIKDQQSHVIWLGTLGGGLNKFDPGTEKFIRYQNEPGDPNSLSENGVKVIFKDKSGVLWIGTWNSDLNKSDPAKARFTLYKNEPGNPNSLSSGPVWSIYESQHDGTLWIGTWGGGLNKFDREEEIWTHYKNEPSNPNSLSSNTVYCIYEDTDEAGKVLWVGTGGGGLNRFDQKNQHFTRYATEPGDPNSLGNNTVWTIYESRNDGILWLGTWSDQLVKFERSKQRFTRYEHDSENPNSLSYCRAVITIYEDPDEAGKILWLGTDGGGLNRFDREKQQFIQYKHEPGNPNSLSENRVISIHEDKSGMFWLGTRAGLNRFSREPEFFTTYLHDYEVQKILEDEDGNFWLSTHKGLLKFDPRTKRSKKYDVNDGLQGNRFMGRVYKSRRTGEIFFGGVYGFNSFFPADIKDNLYLPPVVITDFQIFNKSVPMGTKSTKTITGGHLSRSVAGSNLETNEIVLSYKERVFSFEFAALDFSNPGKNQYAYKMEGLDEDWNPIGARRFTTFTNLSPGEYVFRVKGSNSDGVWNENGASVKISITPPWWKTWWAYTLYLFLSCAAAFSVIRFSTNRTLLRRELELQHTHAKKLEELDRMKSRFFANISHEFRTPLTLILGPVEKLLTDTYDNKLKRQYKLMLRNGRRLLRLINQLLELSKFEAGSMSLKARPENIVKLLESTVLFFSSMAERKRIDLKFNAVQEKIIVYVDRDKLEKIVSNLLSNAFKFTPEGGQVEVGLSIVNSGPNSAIQITVSDTGPGIPSDRINKIFNRFYQVDDSQTREQEGTGIGLALTKELVELHHGEITVDSPTQDGKTEHGTNFTVWLPLGKGHLKADEIIESPIDSFNLEVRVPFESQRDLAEIPEHERSAVSTKDCEVILVVDDNQDMREYMRDFLAETYQILAASDGVEGIEKASEKIPDLIISDVMMPKMDGIEFCHKIKTGETTSHIPVILLTARAAGESKVEGLEIGADDYLTKPFEPRELLARVRNLIEQRRRLRKRFSREITVQPKDIAITSMDEQFLQRAMEIVEKHLSDPEFTTETFAREIGLSRNQLHLKLQALTDQSTHGFIRLLRLKRAAQLLQQGAGTVSEIVYDVGFNNLSHFAKAFRQQFGQSPSQFAASHLTMNSKQ